MKPDPAPAEFIRASGNRLTLGSRPILLTGINFPAYGWARSGYTRAEILGAKNFRAADYRRVAEMGMNVVRLNMSYLLFERDEAPYRYDQEGWDWLNQQIGWARDAGVYLMPDMHAPQGGYQAPGYDGDFWENPELRERLKALWVEIARRYRDETQIAAYSLFNEPFTNNRNHLWVAYAQELVEAIRSVDTNHLLNVEQDVAAMIPFALPDDNLMYDFHCYEPWRYATQFWRYGFQGRYGDPQTPILPWTWREGEICGSAFKVANERIAGLMPLAKTLQGVDEFTITEIEPGGKRHLLMRVQTVDESAPLPVSASVSDDPLPVAATSWTESAPNHLKCEMLAFPVRQGCAYEISGGLEFLALEYNPGDSFAPFTNETIEARLLGEYGLQFYLDRNLPVNVGEYGLSPHAFKGERGGRQMVADRLNLFKKYNINSQYWVYSGAADFALYDNRGEYPEERHVNQALAGLFMEKLKTN
ncbi:MAG: glycoside hydrolase family 5 protein [Anaerolineales bacterium]|nr:glycoside hydrolase family 5 protein [Anaerolineales bacterium]